MKAQELRDELTSVLLPAFKKLEQAATTTEATVLLNDSRIRSIGHLLERYAEEGDVETARRQEQVYLNSIRLLDEYICFREKLPDWETFMMLLHTGRNKLTIV